MGLLLEAQSDQLLECTRVTKAHKPPETCWDSVEQQKGASFSLTEMETSKEGG